MTLQQALPSGGRVPAGVAGGVLITAVAIIIVAAVVVVFSVQNASPVSVAFLSWHFEASLAVVIVLSVLAGVVVGMVIVASVWLRRSVGHVPEDGRTGKS